MTHTHASATTPQHSGLTLSQLWAMLKPWRWWLALVGVSVLLGAVFASLISPSRIPRVQQLLASISQSASDGYWPTS